MDSVSVNLLPQEVLNQRKQKSHTSTAIKVCIGGLVILALVSAVLLGLRFYQTIQLKNAQTSYDQAVAHLDSFKDVSTQLFTLKRQLNAIQDFSTQDTNQKALFSLVSTSMGENLSLVELRVDKKGLITMTLTGKAIEDFDAFVHNLSDPSKNQNLLKQIDLESLSYTKEIGYRFDLKVLPAK